MRINQKFRSDILPAILFLAPNLIGFLAFTLIPLFASFILSFTDCNLLQSQNIFTLKFIGLKNFTHLLGFYRDGAALRANDPEFWSYLWNTVYLLAKIPIVMLFSLLLALFLNESLKGRTFFRSVFFIPTICTGTAVYILWRWMFNADFGLVNFVIKNITQNKYPGPGWLINLAWAKPAFIFMNIWAESGGLNMLIYLAALKSIPEDYYEAGSLDGADAWERFRYITWPMLAPATFFILVINLINGFQEGFQQAHIMTQGGPAGSTTMLSYYIYNQAYVWNHMGYASAIAWILFTIILLITAANWKYGDKTVHYK